MTQEDKELLLIDLCARLPYGVKVRTNRGPELIEGLAPFCHNEVKIALNLDWSLSLSDYTPYLRPLSSMTDEEKGELKLEQEKDEELFIQVINKSQNGDDSLLGTVIPHYAEDWANKNHFDYRGLIEKGLALEAPEGMYNLNKE